MTILTYLIIGTVVATVVETRNNYPIADDQLFIIGFVFMGTIIVWPVIVILSILIGISWSIGKLFQKLSDKI